MPQSLKSLFQTIQKEPAVPVMVLTGGDPFVRKKLQEILIEKALGDALKEMNFAEFLGSELDVAKLIDACRDYPCFAERRVVLLSQCEKIKKTAAKGFLEYLKSPTETTVLIIDGEKLDGRLDWVKLLKKQHAFFEISPPEISDALAWVSKCARQEGKTLEPGVGDRLVEFLGVDFLALQVATTQLAIFVGESDEITLAAVDQLLIKVTPENIFQVIEGVFSHQRDELTKQLGRALKSGEPPLKILSLVFRHVSILLSLKNPETAPSSLMRMPPMARRRYEQQVQKFGRKLNPQWLAQLSRADRDLKSSGLPGELVLQKYLEELS